MSQQQKSKTTLLDKLGVRNLLAVVLTGLFGYSLWYVLNHNVSENPIMLLILGVLQTNLTMVYVFYFRKAQSKESIS